MRSIRSDIFPSFYNNLADLGLRKPVAEQVEVFIFHSVAVLL